jgi:excisionase family DNA binding protein
VSARDQNRIAVAKAVALIQVPNQRGFKMKAAAKYLGIHPQTLRKVTDEGRIRAKDMGGQRLYTLEDLNAYIESLSEWYYGAGERSEASNEEEDNDQ